MDAANNSGDRPGASPQGGKAVGDSQRALFARKAIMRCRPHSIPFRIIFQEYQARREDELNAAIRAYRDQVRDKAAPAEPIPWLLDKIAASENAYQRLQSKLAVPSENGSTVETAVAACHETDEPLKRILHAMQGSALCLSGGGIRSASFSLGIVEGLARFSQKRGANSALTPDQESGALLNKLDYLSTVSGGGYIGSWLSAWILRATSGAQSSEAYKGIVRQLSGNDLFTSADPWPRTVRHLRDYTNYLMPHMGFSLDTWSIVAIVLRNMFVNWLMIVPVLIAGLAVMQVARFGLRAAIGAVTVHHESKYLLFLLVLPPFALAVCIGGRLRPSATRAGSRLLNWATTSGRAVWSKTGKPLYSGISSAAMAVRKAVAGHPRNAGAQPSTSSQDLSQEAGPSGKDRLANAFRWTKVADLVGKFSRPFQTDGRKWKTGWVFGWYVLPVLVGCWITAAVAYSFVTGQIHPYFRILWAPSNSFGGEVPSGLQLFYPSQTSATLFICGVTIIAFGWLAFGLYAAVRNRIETKGRVIGDQSKEGEWTETRSRFLGLMFLSVIAVAVTIDVLLLLSGRQLASYIASVAQGNDSSFEDAYVLLAGPLICGVLMIGSSIFSALANSYEQEEDREWWSRVGGAMMASCVVWVGSMALSIYGPSVWHWLIQPKHWELGLSLPAAAGGLGVAGGFSGKTGAGTRPVKSAQLGAVGKFLDKHELVLPALCLAGTSLILLILTVCEQFLEHQLESTYLVRFHHWFVAAVIFFLSATVALITNRIININIFSLGGMYRMRLMRAFLGASNPKRQPNQFTGFDPEDSPKEKDLPVCQGVPLHIINATLNLVGTKDTAWRQRKAESFTFSPICCGSWRVGYAPTAMYGGYEGITLATAMTVSGAAFNPNMGYHSSPLVTFLMTLFNARLGSWLPNPARVRGKPIVGVAALSEVPDGTSDTNFLRRSGPSFSFGPLLREMFGATNDTYKWIEVTDGAHFENLGLFEMVLRRCHNIIVVDAGADPNYQFEDLGNALRKIEIDLGIPINFASALPMIKQGGVKNWYSAVAKIDYPCVDGGDATGNLIYIKAVLRGTEPPDIRQYAATHPTFPHETTANQFFNESQFESYRHLGSYIVDQLVLSNPDSAQTPTIEEFCIAAGSLPRVNCQFVYATP